MTQQSHREPEPYDPDGPDPTHPVGREEDAMSRRKARPRRLQPKPGAPEAPTHRDPTGSDTQPEAGGAEPDPFKIG
jgi:hypothetical protein